MKTDFNFFFSTAEMRKRDRLYRVLGNVLVSFLLFFGVGSALFFVFPAQAVPAVPLVTGLVIIALQCVFFEFKKLKYLGATFPVLVIVAILMCCNKYVKNGFAIFLNAVSETLGRRFGRIFTEYEVSAAKGTEIICITLFFVIAAVVISSVVTAAVKVRSGIPLFLLFCSVIILFLLFGNGITDFEIILSLISMAAALTIRGARVASGTSDRCGRACTASCLAALIFLSVIALPLSLKTYGGNTSDRIKNDLEDITDRIRYGKNELPEGDFSALGNLELSDETVLEVIMSEPEEIWLRGYVGSVYNGTGWEDLPNEELYKYSNLFKYLHEYGFYGQTQLSTAVKTAYGDSEDKMISVTINNVGASRKYIYAPYEYVSDDEGLLDKREIGDVLLRSSGFKGKEYYRFDMQTNQVKKYTETASRLAEKEQNGEYDVEQYMLYESYYNSFIYENFTYIPDNVRNILSNHLGEYEHKTGEHASYSAAKQKILGYLTENIEYSAEIPVMAENKDFVQYFLEETCAGYSVHYATAAALMFRYYGIPARYVEGYIITSEDTQGKLSNSIIEVSGERAHAWVEIYQDGMGWVPFETTPAYIGVMEQAENIQGTAGKSQEDESESDDGLEDESEASLENGTNDNVLMMYIRIIGKIAVYMMLVIITVILAISAAYIIKKRIMLKIKLKVFKTASNNRAVWTSFAYALELLQSMGIEKTNGSLSELEPLVEEKFGAEYGKKFAYAAELNSEALFSDHEMTDENRNFMMSFYTETLGQLKRRSNMLKRIGFRIRGLY